MVDYERNQVPMIIDNEPAQAASGATMPTYNPATGEQLAEVPDAGTDDVAAAVAAARATFDGGKWSRASGQRRTRLMFSLADLLWRDFDSLAELESKDNGNVASPFSPTRWPLVPLPPGRCYDASPVEKTLNL